MSNQKNTSFEQAARTHADRGALFEILQFLSTNKRWWMAPIVLTLLLFGVLIFLSSTAAAPFIYTLF